MVYTEDDAQDDVREMLGEYEMFFDEWLDVTKFHQCTVSGNDFIACDIASTAAILQFASLSNSALSALTSEAEIEVFSEFTSQYTPTSLMTSLPLRYAVSTLLEDDSRYEISSKQLKKDLERDQLIINGQRIIGADVGLSGIRSALSQTIDTLLSTNSLPLFGTTAKDLIVTSVLSNASRTHSGAIAFNILRAILDPSLTLLFPLSSLAQSLQIKVSLGANRSYGRKTSQWGVNVEVVASTFFSIQDSEAADTESTESQNQVEVEYHNIIFIAIDPRLPAIENIIIYGQTPISGIVTMRRCQ